MADVERQLALEGAHRVRIAACAAVAGLMLFGGEVWITLVNTKEPIVGLLQGLKPAFKGMAAATVDPRTAREHFLISHQTALIVAFLITGVATLLIVPPLRYLSTAETYRAERPSPLAHQFAAIGPILYGIGLPAFEISLIVGAHNYISGNVFTSHAFDASTGGGVRIALQIILTLGTLIMAVAFVMVSLRSMRVGLLTRMMGIIGIIGGVLFVIPLTPLPVIQALWLVFFAAMLLGLGSRPLPEAWTVGEARPWPPRQPAQPRPTRQRGGGGQRRGSAPPVPAPAAPRGPSPSASKKRKRRR